MPVQNSVIAPDLKIQGDLISQGDIKVEGSVEGSISCRTLTLGDKPVLNCSVIADTVRVSGEFSGQVKAAKVILTRNARFRGDIFQEVLEIEDGALVEGFVGRLDPKEEQDDKAEATKLDGLPNGAPGSN